jgi:hypothetical protein
MKRRLTALRKQGVAACGRGGLVAETRMRGSVVEICAGMRVEGWTR